MKLIPFSFDKHGDWVKKHVRCILCQDTSGLLAEKDGELVGAMMCDSWTKNSVQVHIAILDPVCLKHKMHYEFCEWVFNRAGMKQMLGLVPSNNAKALRLNEHFGFNEIARVADAYEDGVDYVVMQMMKDECKYITRMKGAA